MPAISTSLMTDASIHAFVRRSTGRLLLAVTFAAMLAVPAAASAQSEPCAIRSGGTTPSSATRPAPRADSASGARRDTSRLATRSDSGPVDVVIFAAAQVGEIRFASQPDIRVRLCGGLDSVHVLERRNLPSPVVAGTTYRDVYVAVQIFGRLTADCIARTLTGTRARADSVSASAVGPDCASLELRGTSGRSGASQPPGARPPNDSTRPPRR
jgi:hypothetical protein